MTYCTSDDLVSLDSLGIWTWIWMTSVPHQIVTHFRSCGLVVKPLCKNTGSTGADESKRK